MKHYKTSRILNENRVLLGLSYMDVAAIGVVLYLAQKAVNFLGLGGIWAFYVSVTFGVILIPIRTRFRRKIIRDVLRFCILKILGPVSVKGRKL